MKTFAAVVLGFVGGVIACGLSGKIKLEPQPDQLTGKGSTFVYPLMIHWSSAYGKGDEGGRIDYSPLGSGSGIKALLDKKVDFACTDAPLSDEQLAKARAAGAEVIHVPLVLGAVVPVYNLSEVSEILRFSGPVLADIYLGKITKWNDKALQELNPKVAQELPDKQIRVAHRKDGSGTTYIWVDYLAKVSAECKQKLGVGTEVPWPTGSAEPGNEGVAEYVKRTPGSIGYVELAYASRRELPFGLVQNREKEFVKAGFDSVGKAATNGLTSVPDDLRFSLTDPPGQGSYPICGATWAVVQGKHTPEKKKLLVNFLYWALDKGQEEADLLFYHRLPPPLRERAEKQLAKML
jgi:phosphate ABC transporter phosphate-binding protein